MVLTVAVAGMLDDSSCCLFPFLEALLLLLVSFASSIDVVLPSLRQLRGDAGSGGLGSGLDGGRPFFFFFFFSAFFPSALFSSVSVCSFCFLRCCCRRGRQWQPVVMMKCSVPSGVVEGGKKMVSYPRWRAVFCCCFLRLRGGAGSCFFFQWWRGVWLWSLFLFSAASALLLPSGGAAVVGSVDGGGMAVVTIFY